jgi:heme oxygenase
LLQQILKRETASYHSALEAEVDVVGCLGSANSWLWLLKTFYTFWTPVEARAFSPPGFGGWLPDSQDRRRAHRLHRDIEALGGNPDDLLLCTELPQLDSLARRFGCLYVMEGSSLGGQQIVKLATSCGYTAERGCSYFASYGDRVGSMWKAFVEHLDAYGTAYPEQMETAVASAIETFTKFRGWLASRKFELNGIHDHAPER